MRSSISRFSKLLLSLPSWAKILISLLLSIPVGLILGEKAQIFQPIANLFINAIMMMVAPVVFTSLICGVISMHNPSQMGRVALKTIFLYFITMVMASAIAVGIAFICQPGASLGSSIQNITQSLTTPSKTLSLLETLIQIVPANMFAPFLEGNVIQIIFLAILFGLAINKAGDTGKPLARFFNSLSDVIFSFIQIIMKIAPIGIFALMTTVAGKHGIGIITSLFYTVAVAYLAMIVVMILVYGSGLLAVGLRPFTFFRKMIEAQVIAFSTSSSAATLPINLKISEKYLGIKKNIGSFILPLGSTINMNGLTAYIGVAVVFSANAYGIHLDFADYLKVIFTATFASLGCAGVPAAALIVLPVVLTSVGIPLEAVGFIAAIDRIIDMLSTATNITGDTFTATLVAKSEGDLDENIYNSQNIDESIPHSFNRTREHSSLVS